MGQRGVLTAYCMIVQLDHPQTKIERCSFLVLDIDQDGQPIHRCSRGHYVEGYNKHCVAHTKDCNMTANENKNIWLTEYVTGDVLRTAKD